MSKRFTIEAVIKGVDRFSAPISRMQNRTKRFLRNTQAGLLRVDRKIRKVTRSLKRMGSRFKKVAVAGVATFFIIGAVMADTIKTGAEFEQTLVNASAKFGILNRHTGEGVIQFKKLEDAARRAGETTEFKATEAAEALNFLGLAGFTAEQAIASLPGVIDLATVAQTDLASATDIATGALGAFGLKVDDTVQLQKNLTRVSDVLAKTSITSKTTLESLIETIKLGGPVAKIAGADLETFATFAGKLGDAALKGTDAGTILKNMFVKLSAPTKRAQKILDRLGVTTRDSNGNLLDAIDILGDLGKGLSKLGTAEKAGVLKELFDLRAIAGVSILLDVGTDKLKAYREELRQAGGTSKTLAAVMRDTLSTQFKIFNSLIESAKIDAFKFAEGSIKKVVERMTEWIKKNKEFISQQFGAAIKFIADNAGKILILAAAFTVLAGTLLAVVLAIKLLILVNTLLTISLVPLLAAAAPFVLLGVIIVGIVAIIIAAVIWFKEWTKWLRNSSGAFKILLIAAGAFVFGPVGALLALIVLIIAHWDELQAVFEEAFFKMFVILDGWVEGFKKAFKTIGEVFTDIWASIVSVAKRGTAELLIFVDEIRLKFLEAKSLFTTDKGELAVLGAEIRVIENRIRLREKELGIVNKIRGIRGGAAGLGAAALFAIEGAEEIPQGGNNAQAPQVKVVGPNEVLNSILERKETTTNKTEITIRDESGRAEQTGPSVPGLNLMQSGGFE